MHIISVNVHLFIDIEHVAFSSFLKIIVTNIKYNIAYCTTNSKKIECDTLCSDDYSDLFMALMLI